MFTTHRRNVAVRWAVLLLLRRMLKRRAKPEPRVRKSFLLGAGVAALVGAVAFFWLRGGGKDYTCWDPAHEHGPNAHDGSPASPDPVPGV